MGKRGVAEDRARATWLRRALPDLLAIGALALVVFCYLSPALKDGPTFGPADLGRGLSLLTQTDPPTPVHNVVNGDTITQSAGWNALNWHLVHDGQLPLWNDLSGNGLPELLNFESAPLALPSLLGYLFPLDLSFLVTIAVKLLLAGTGTYLTLRLLRARPVAAFLGGVTFMLSGAFSGWLGWSISGAFCWSGFLVAGALLAYRSRRRALPLLLLGGSVAFAAYGGFPEAALILGGPLVLAGGLTLLVARRNLARGGLLRVGAGIGLGVALAAPLWLPGASILTGSARANKHAATGLPFGTILLSLTQGYNGLPYSQPVQPLTLHQCVPNGPSCYFGPNNYFETAAYVGIVAFVLGVVALACSWRRPIVSGLGISALATMALIYRLPGSGHDPVQHLVRAVGLGTISVQRALSALAFLLALLAGLGGEVLLARWREAGVRRAFVATTLVLAVIVLVAGVRGAHPAFEGALRERSLWWPTAILVLLGGLSILLIRARQAPEPMRGRVTTALGLSLATAQATFLLFAGVGLNSYAPVAFPQTASTAALSRAVGESLVGFDAPYVPCPSDPAVELVSICGVRVPQGEVGYYPEMNLGYGQAELAVHDPATPQFYFSSWPLPNQGQVSIQNLNLFSPPLTSAALARRYGVSYILAAPGLVPTGARRVGTVPIVDQQPETLYAVPNSGRFTVAGRHGSLVGPIEHRSARSYGVSVRTDGPAELVAHVTDLPGWHVSVNGHPVSTRRVDGAFIGIPLPGGTAHVAMSYWPAGLTIGLGLAAVGLAALGAYAIAMHLARRRAAQAA